MAVAAIGGRGAQQRHHIMGNMRAGGPDFLAVDLPAVVDFLRAGFDIGEIGAGARLAQANGEIAFTGSDPRQDIEFLRFAAMGNQHRRVLAVGNPVGANRSARAQCFFGDNIAFERALVVAAILARPGQADPAALAHFLRKFGIGRGHPAFRFGFEIARVPFCHEERLQVGSQLLQSGIGLNDWKIKSLHWLFSVRPELVEGRVVGTNALRQAQCER